MQKPAGSRSKHPTPIIHIGRYLSLSGNEFLYCCFHNTFWIFRDDPLLDRTLKRLLKQEEYERVCVIIDVLSFSVKEKKLCSALDFERPRSLLAKDSG